ncbi:MAG TPA: LysR family transcriptional regulator [Polyangiaceae bacterium]|jgi:DNA-binding transcriptional LysR family regulator|nr:LysR family transcriptional regulator [Polyangiaceae bacterium]
MDAALLPALYDALILARTGSVGLAARKLGKTPSAVSQQIRHLSDALGVVLFERQGRGLVATAAAQRILPAATRLFDEAEAVSRLIGELTGSAATTLRLAASDYLAKPLLVPVLRELAEQGAPLHFQISTAHSEEAIGMLERGEVEMAIVSFPGERSGLTARKLFDQAFFWVGPKQVRGRRSLMQRLELEPVLRLGVGSVGRKLLDDYLERHRIHPASTIDVPSVSLLLAYASGGVGIGLAPALPLGGIEARRLAVERAPVSTLPVKLLTRAGRPEVPIIERFVARLVQEAERAQGVLGGAD